MAFTGDALLIRGCGRTDFQQGTRAGCSARCATSCSRCRTTCLLYPGHDYRGLTASSVGEEKMYNPRLAEIHRRRRFRRLHDATSGSPHPKLMEVAVPANLRCGRPEKEDDDERRPTPTGRPCPTPSPASGKCSRTGWRRMLGRVQVMDVREPDEFNGALGHIKGAKLIPLGSLTGEALRIGKDAPVGHGVPLGRALGAGDRDAAGMPATRKSPTSPAACCAGAASACRSKAARD